MIEALSCRFKRCGTCDQEESWNCSCLASNAWLTDTPEPSTCFTSHLESKFWMMFFINSLAGLTTLVKTAFMTLHRASVKSFRAYLKKNLKFRGLWLLVGFLRVLPLCSNFSNVKRKQWFKHFFNRRLHLTTSSNLSRLVQSLNFRRKQRGSLD